MKGVTSVSESTEYVSPSCRVPSISTGFIWLYCRKCKSRWQYECFTLGHGLEVDGSSFVVKRLLRIANMQAKLNVESGSANLKCFGTKSGTVTTGLTQVSVSKMELRSAAKT